MEALLEQLKEVIANKKIIVEIFDWDSGEMCLWEPESARINEQGEIVIKAVEY